MQVPFFFAFASLVFWCDPLFLTPLMLRFPRRANFHVEVLLTSFPQFFPSHMNDEKISYVCLAFILQYQVFLCLVASFLIEIRLGGGGGGGMLF